MKLSPNACEELLDAVEAGGSTTDLEEQTDCPEGCVVEPDAYCAHGYLSAAETLLRTVA
jgi:hypothetical protein